MDGLGLGEGDGDAAGDTFAAAEREVATGETEATGVAGPQAAITTAAPATPIARLVIVSSTAVVAHHAQRSGRGRVIS